jgi:hypothetical protein
MSTPTPAAPSAPIAPTPGPWTYSADKDTRGWYSWRIDSDEVSLIAALTYGSEQARNAGEADAALIAAAPDLRDALARTIPLLVRLGDFIGNGALNTDRPSSLGERCDVIGDARALLTRLGVTL